MLELHSEMHRFICLKDLHLKTLALHVNRLGSKLPLDECVILQTCNRVEVFGAGATINERKLLESWASQVGMASEEFAMGARSVRVRKSSLICLG